jgi:hypothetical protein
MSEAGSSVSIVAGYGLGDRGSIRDRGTGFFLKPVRKADSGAHTASYTMGIGGSFPGVTSGRGVMLILLVCIQLVSKKIILPLW